MEGILDGFYHDSRWDRFVIRLILFGFTTKYGGEESALG